jgi:outer membrane protein W
VGDTRAATEDLSARAAFLYGGGVKAAYAIKDRWIIGLDAQFLASDHKLDFSATTASGAVIEATYDTCRMQAWHVAPYIAGKIANWTPYAGGKYSDLWMKQEGPDDPKRWDNLRFKADRNIGIFAGADWNLGDHFKLNVEGSFIDETAMTVCAAYRF